MKMLGNSETSILHINNEKGSCESRVFGYTLNEKRAKSKLLKGAQRTDHLNAEIKSGCVNLRFSDGSFYEIVLPLIGVWQQKKHSTVQIDENIIEIVEVLTGTEINDKHVDTKLIVKCNNDRLVIHIYNSTQNLMIQGKNYEKFAIDILKPFFAQKIEFSKEKIIRINDEVKKNLGPKKPLKSKAGVPFKCPQCEHLTLTKGELKVHMKTCHTKPGISPPKSTKFMKILNEDATFGTDTSSLTLKGVCNYYIST